MQKCFASGLFIMLLFASCNSGTSPGDLWNSQGLWRLQSIGTTSIPSPENYTVQFEEDGRMHVRADCNNCNGNYETKGNTITVGVLACTRAFCGEHSLSNTFIDGLSRASVFARRSDMLDLTSPDGTLTFRVAP